MRFPLPCLALVLAPLSVACVNGPDLDRRLLLTEVSTNEVELHLDEDPSRQLNLGDGFVLEVRTDDGAGNVQRRALGLGAGEQSIPGGGFFMVWEESGYQGPPAAAPYSGGQQGFVPGIKVRAGFLTGLGSLPTEVRLTGSRDRITRVVVLFPETTTDHVGDVVRFGAPVAQRPDGGGGSGSTFADDGSLQNPSGSNSVQRAWASGRPVDTDAESDWSRGGSSWGVPTP